NTGPGSFGWSVDQEEKLNDAIANNQPSTRIEKIAYILTHIVVLAGTHFIYSRRPVPSGMDLGEENTPPPSRANPRIRPSGIRVGSDPQNIGGGTSRTVENSAGQPVLRCLVKTDTDL